MFLLWELLLAKVLSVGMRETEHVEESLGDCRQQFVMSPPPHLCTFTLAICLHVVVLKED